MSANDPPDDFLDAECVGDGEAVVALVADERFPVTPYVEAGQGIRLAAGAVCLEAVPSQATGQILDPRIVLANQIVPCVAAADVARFQPPPVNVREQVGFFPRLAIAEVLGDRTVLDRLPNRIAPNLVPIPVDYPVKVVDRGNEEADFRRVNPDDTIRSE
jgi:hypothetical protein